MSGCPDEFDAGLRFEQGWPGLWTVIASPPGLVLGQIEWVTKWQRFAIVPAPEVKLSPVVLRQLADFCDKQTKAYTTPEPQQN